MNDTGGTSSTQERRGFWMALAACGGLVVLFLFPDIFWPRPSKHVARQALTEAQMQALNTALSQYYQEYGAYPRALEMLRLPEHALLDGDVNLDAWKNPLKYEFGTDGLPVLTSFGKDGRPGGEGYDQDIIVRVTPDTQPASRPAAEGPQTQNGSGGD